MPEREALDPERYGASAIAIIGMAGRFPGAASVAELWSNLRAGRESIRDLTPEEILAAGVDPALLAEPGYVRRGVVLGDIDLFDCNFFGLTPRQAQLMDPQHRLLLECAWLALEDAAEVPERCPYPIGVFAGANSSGYLLRALGAGGRFPADIDPLVARILNDKDFLTTWISYLLNLKGPSVAVQTACSTSLVAVHLACQALLNGECGLALAGGAALAVPQGQGYLYREGSILSPDGRCRAFDAAANGTVSGSGAGIVVLKRLADALADGDRVRAVIRASAINNDGSIKVGFTAPSVEGQAAVIAEALAVAGVEPASISYIESHGTGTPLGDPVEIAALTQAFGATTERGYCAVGSLKSNIGHLDAAAGVAGLIKVVLALEHGELPPSLHVREPNPKINFAASPFFVNTERRPWRPNGVPRRAGVSSFGIGGTNAHVIVEEAPAAASSGPGREWQLFPLSAPSAAQLEGARGELVAHLTAHPEFELADVAFTLAVGRRTLPRRLVALGRDRGELVAALAGAAPERLLTRHETQRGRGVDVLFPGQGAQYAGMGRALYASEPVFRREIDRGLALVSPELRQALSRLVLNPPLDVAAADDELRQTRLTQPALYLVEFALALLWRSWGIEPRAMLGHSVGEYVAAALAGVFSFEQGLALVARRAELIAGLPPGAMLAVPLSEEETLAQLPPALALSAVNGVRRVVVSGNHEDIETYAQALAASGVATRRLHTSHAFHSPALAPIVAPFRELLAAVPLAAPMKPYVSNLTGTWAEPGLVSDPEYWVQHLLSPVRFSAGIATLQAGGPGVLLEVGPGRTLASLAQQAGGGTAPAVIGSLPEAKRRGEDLPELAKAVASLWLHGVEPDWRAYHGDGARKRLPLPPTPLARKRHWLDVESSAAPETPERGPRMLASEPTPNGLDRHRNRLARELGQIVTELTGVRADEVDPRSSFLELGVDSLLMIQAAETLENRFGVKLSLRQLMEELPTLEAVAGFLAETLPPAPETQPAAPPEPSPVVQAEPATVAVGASAFERLAAQQIAAMSALFERQLGALAGSAAPPGAGASLAPAPPLPPSPPLPAAPPPQPLLPTGVVKLRSRAGLPPAQLAFLDTVIERYCRKTAGSKAIAQRTRRAMADPRSSAGFRSLLKEMIYPLVAVRSSGSRLWDVDGNEYVDLTMGFGAHFFGHAPPFLTAALSEQLDKGYHLGPQSDLAGEVAEAVTELTGVERVAFLTTGSDAVVAALRLARAVTRRRSIAFFTNSYHGSADGVLARGLGPAAGLRSLPLAPGVPPGAVEDVLVLDYGEARSLDLLRERAGDLAAVLVEPVQSRRPDLQPGDFLRQLRQLTTDAGTALIFDEVVTGFRSHPGGAQAVFDVRADLVTYGKVLGGGQPIGVVAGRAAFMDAVDGGFWTFGDASYPAVPQTFFAGTFNKHPLTMAAARAVTERLRRDGPALQEGLNGRMADLGTRLNRLFAELAAPFKVVWFSSLFRFVYPADQELLDLFFFLMNERGVHIWEGRTCFLSTAHTAEDIDFIVAAARASLEELHAAGILGPPPAAGPPPSGRRTPLTAAQTEIWLAAQFGDQASAAYNECVVLRLRGALERGVLARSWRRLVARHEALRASFEAGGASQSFAPSVPAPLPVIDLSALPPAAREERTAALGARLGGAAFDLARPGLSRTLLLAHTPAEHVLLLVVHHLVIDGRAMAVLLDELAHLYERGCRRLPPALPPILPFSDFVARAASRSAGATEEHWLGVLEPLPAALTLPTDRPRAAAANFAGAMLRTELSAALGSALGELATACRVTPTTLYLGLFQALLHRLSGQADLIVGLPFASAGRQTRGALVGLTLNVLPLRSRVADDPETQAYLKRVQEGLLAAVEKGNVAFRDLARRLHREGDGPTWPLFSTTFNLDPAGTFELYGLAVEMPAAPVTAAKFELSLNLTDRGAGLAADWSFQRELFDAITIRRWAAHFAHLAASAAANPRAPLLALDLFGPAERQQLTREWNDTATAAPAGTVHGWILAAARRAPEAIATVARGEALSYGALANAALALASELALRGVGLEDRVGLSLEPSPELLVALLGTLIAGAAYLPLDPTAPAPRRAAMAADGEIAAWIGEPGAMPPPALPVGRCLGPELLRSMAPRADPALSASAEFEGDALADALCYVLFTSGSTGRPKGVLVTHAGVVHYLAWCLADYLDGSGLGAPVHSPLSFDLTVTSLLAPLAAGRTVHLLEPGLEALVGALSTGPPFGLVKLTPAHLKALSELLDPALLGERRECLVVGGEQLYWADLAFWRQHAPRLRVVNEYGPTETVVGVSTFTALPATAPLPSGAVAIGQPIDRMAAWVVDGRGRLAAPGVPGEILLGGAGVARGYARRPGQTAVSFIPDALSGSFGGRLYKSGDLGRHDAGGALHFLGRQDRQVKVRGYRIELGEIEAALLAHAGVVAALALLGPGREGERPLLAYAVPAASATADALELRSFLAERLPPYMVPQALTVIERFPLNRHGKVDTAALPRPVMEGAAGGADALSPTAELLAQIWSEVLGVSPRAPGDHFFSLGGHSLLATQVAGRVRRLFGVELPLARFFSEPTLGGQAAAIDTLRSRSHGGALPPLEVAAEPGAPEVPSFAQERLWFLDQLEPGQAAYNIPLTVRARGRLRPAALSASFQEIARRHRVLATVFPAANGIPVPSPIAGVPVRLRVVDLSALAPGDGVAETLCAQEARRPFDLARGPLLRLLLLRLAAADHLLTATFHHIVADGWSLGRVVTELASLYPAFCSGRSSPLPALPCQYSDFARWQRLFLKGEVLARQLDYWRQQLAGAPPRLELSADRPAGSRRSAAGELRSQPLAGSLVEDLERFARQRSSTLFMVGLAAYAVLLSRLASQREVVIGSPIANRIRPEVEPLIGCFVNTLALRLRPAPDLSFSALLDQARETSLAAYAHQDLPFERLVDELAPARQLAHAPIFQVLFLVQNFPLAALSLPELRLEPQAVGTGTSKFDLTLSLWPSPGALWARLDYSRDLFDTTTAERTLRHFTALLRQAITRPDAALAALSSLAASERQQVLLEWNDTRVAPWARVALHHHVERTWGEHPESIALAFADEQLSFAELAARSHALARVLARHGVAADVLVGVLIERSLELPVALLAILEAGGAYVPLDPSYPVDRLAYMLADSEAPVLVTQRHLAELLPAGRAERLLVEREDWAALDRRALATFVHGDHLACVLYTSGTTGKPKGVADTHDGVVNQISWMQARFGMERDDRVLQKTPISWDVSIWELFWTMATGARLVLAKPGGHGDPAYLAAAIAERAVTVMHFVPSVLRVFLEVPAASGVTTFRRVISSGELLTLDVQQAFFERYPPARENDLALFNHYGPGESARASHYVCLPGDRRQAVPIGRPSHDVDIHLVDERFWPVPLGVVGELWVGGRSLARGYWKRPGQTAARFVPHPFTAEQGLRIYRTGDRVRRLADGTLEFLGRIDFQVKVRGVRVELGEIEGAILAQTEVESAVVLVREDRPGDQRLVAYLVAAPEAAAEGFVARVEAALAAQLPSYMVPSVFVPLPAMPLAPNGKLDRGALPVPAWTNAATAAAPPQTPTEAALAALWSELLGLAAVDPASSFFALGGHSLLATRLVARIAAARGVELPVRAVFEHPTIAELATHLDALADLAARQRTPPLAAAIGEAPLPLSFAQERLWFLERLQPGLSTYHMPVFLRLSGALDLALLARALTAVMARHAVLRSRFFEVAGQRRQEALAAAPLRLPIVELTGVATSVRARLLNRELERPFPLERGPLLRGSLLRLAHDQHWLLLTLHHAAGDAWSLEILWSEVEAIYGAGRGGQAVLAPLPLQYGDFAAWQRSWLAGPRLDEELDAWRRLLANLPASLALPFDRPRPAQPSARGQRLPFSLATEATALRGAAHGHGATVFMVLLAALVALLHRLTGEPALPVGSPVANRGRAEVTGLIGFFVNTLVLCLDCAATLSFSDLVAAARQTVLAALSHQDLPFEKLVAELEGERDLGRNPLFQVSLIVQEEPARRLSLPEVEIAPLAAAVATAKFDLSLFIGAGADGLAGEFEYKTDLFDRTTIARLAAQWQRLLSAALHDPTRLIGALPLLATAEEHQLIWEWNDTAATERRTIDLARLLEAQLDGCGERLAVCAADGCLSYGELHRRASCLAHFLLELGLAPDGVLGLALPRGCDLAVGVLGVLAAGGAYLPLDLALPRLRLGLIVADARPDWVITERGESERVRQLGAAPLLLDGLDGWALPPGRSLHLPDTAPENLAYVIYTSGSTGQPKGVMVTRGGLRSYLDFAVDRYAPAAGRGAPVHSSLGFDLTVTSLFLPWLAGETVELLAEDEGAVGLASALGQTGGFSLVKLTPAHLELVARQLPPQQAAGAAATLVVGGEALIWGEGLTFFRTHAPSCRVFNEYGPTETVVGSVVEEVRDAHGEGNLSIGRPIHRTRLWILDGAGEVAPLGCPGELWIESPGVARGYLGRPGLTAERFVPVPRPAAAGARCYRTGDRVRTRSDGRLEFLGRRDHQIKLRGFRIELGEIEATLTTHPAVLQAVVLVQEPAGRAQLVAYLVAREPAPADSELRAFLSGLLPRHMVPAEFVPLAALPLTSNGKVDRRRLPAVTIGEAPAPELPEAASHPAEELIAGAFADVLGLRKVGVHQDFFALGGHSLLAMQVISALREIFGVEVPLDQFFLRPTAAGLAEQIAALGDEPLLPPIAPAAAGGEGQLSFAQQRLWFLDRLSPDGPLYAVPLVLRLEGGLEVRALAGALLELLTRHAVLRTIFPVREEGAARGEPDTVIRPLPARPSLPTVDLGGLPAGERAEVAPVLARRGIARRFDLATGPLLRSSVLRLTSSEHLFVLCLHHIITDGWSMSILFRELSLLYTARLTAAPPPLAPPPLQYADYAHWQRQWLRDATLARELDVWRQRLLGVPALDLTTDRPRPALQSFRGARATVLLPPAELRLLHQLGRRLGATLFMTLCTAFQALLARASGQLDFAVATPVAGRVRRELEGMVGLFINTLVLRAELRGNPTFAELAARVRSVALEAYAHQALPFERLVEEAAVERDLARPPLAQVIVAVHNLPQGELELPGLKMRRLGLDVGEAKFELGLGALEAEDGLVLSFDYNADLFDATTLERMTGHFLTLLRGALREPGLRLSELPLASAAERHQTLVEPRQPERDAPPPLLARVAARAAAAPESVALTDGDTTLSAARLLAEAVALGAHLRRAGLGPEDRIGISLPLGPEQVIAVLGVLQSGAAYVPLDPASPEARLARIATSSALAALIRPAQSEPAPFLASLRQFPLPSPAPFGEEASAAEEPDESSLAYLLFTSGSTGEPNGVGVSRASLSRLVAEALGDFALDPSARVLRQISLGFDASALELFLPLTAGCPMVLGAEGEAGLGGALVERLQRLRVTTLVTTPATLALLPVEELAQLEMVSIGGEAAAAALAERWAVGRRLLNCYGPTETTVYATREVCRAPLGAVPGIGAPLPGVAAWVLDRWGNPAPMGVPGELWLGGWGLARGYLNSRALSAERFRPDHLGGRPGARLYRTGDRVRRGSDGRLSFLGRLDDQVKVRGLRIELAEVEAALFQHPRVAAAAALTRGEGANQRLEALIVAHPGDEGSDLPAILRLWLRDRLPAYMVPSHLALCSALPTTASGKLDRRRLRSVQPLTAGGSEPPRRPFETRIARLWEEVLERRPIGIHDDFFTLGGHSLLAVRLVALLAREFRVHVPISVLFAAPTVAGLAKHFATATALPEARALVPLCPTGTQPPLFLVHPIGGTVFCYRELSAALGEEQPVFAFEAPGLSAGTTPARRVEELAAAYVEELLGQCPAGPFRVAGWSFGGLVALEVARGLLERGLGEVRLTLLDSVLPSRRRQAASEWESLLAWARDLAALHGRRLALEPRELAGLGPRAGLALTLDRLLAAGALSAADRELGERLAAVDRAHRAAAEVFRPAPYPGPIELVVAAGGKAHRGAAAWNAVASGGLVIHQVPGDHYSLLRAPRVGAVAALLARR